MIDFIFWMKCEVTTIALCYPLMNITVGILKSYKNYNNTALLILLLIFAWLGIFGFVGGTISLILTLIWYI